MNRISAKILGWHGVVAVLAWKLWDYGRYVSFNSVTGINFEPAAVLNFVLLAGLMALGYGLFRKKIWPVSVSGAVGLLFLGYFGFTPLNLLGIGLFILLNLYAQTNVVRELSQRIKINIRQSLRAGLFPVVMAFFLIISFAAYQSPVAKTVEKNQTLPPAGENIIKIVVETIVIGEQIPGGSQEKENTVNKITGEVFRQINEWLKPYFKYAPPLVAFGLFLILWGLSWFFVWLSVLLGMLIFWILKKSGVVRIEERDVKAEVLVV